MMSVNRWMDNENVDFYGAVNLVKSPWLGRLEVLVRSHPIVIINGQNVPVELFSKLCFCLHSSAPVSSGSRSFFSECLLVKVLKRNGCWVHSYCGGLYINFSKVQGARWNKGHQELGARGRSEEECGYGLLRVLCSFDSWVLAAVSAYPGSAKDWGHQYHAGGRDFRGIPLPEDLFIVNVDGGAGAVFFSIYPQVRCPRPGNNPDETHQVTAHTQRTRMLSEE